MTPGAALPLLSGWHDFYMVIGTAAATLTGLMFVAATLIAGIDRHTETLNAGLSAFNAPTVVHFCAVLLLAGILSAPWQTFSTVGLVLGLLSLGLMIYLLTVMRQMRRVPQFQTPLKDWLWYLVLPLSAYLALIVAAFVMPANPALALYVVSAAMFALLFLGIHNAWDLVTYLAVERSHAENRTRD